MRQHFGIMIELKDQPIAAREIGAHMRGRLPDIRQDSQAPAPGRNHVLNRLTRIVRDGEGLNFEASDIKSTITVDDPEIQALRIFTAGNPGSMGHPDRQGMFSRQTENTADVISMFVGHQDPGQIGGMLAETQHAGDGFPQPKTTIKHQTGIPGLGKQRITGAAAAE